MRYLDEQRVFKKYQWIEASITRTSSDTRPESYRVNFNDIQVQDFIETAKNGNWDQRAEWILNSNTLVELVESVEALKHQQQQTRRSLGIIKPKRIEDIRYEPIPFEEKIRWKRKYDSISAQQNLPFMDEEKLHIQPIPPPDFRFKVRFTCNDSACIKPHDFSILDWEVDALYNRMRGKHNTNVSADKVIEKIETYCASNKDTHFFLGNISSHPQVFTIVGLWYPRINNQENLF